MQYLAPWRKQVAASLFARGLARNARVGREVGHDSEAAFSRGFKRATGLAPGAWRAGVPATSTSRPHRDARTAPPGRPDNVA